MHNQLLDNLFVYKKTSALLAAFQLGLFRQIAEHSYICWNKEICSKFGLNERYAELLCVYLANEGYLVKVDSGWQINQEFEKQLDAFEKICEYETALFHKWLSPRLIVSSVKSAKDNRPFDKEGFAPEEQDAYDNTMYGDNVKLIAFHLLRKIKSGMTFPVQYIEYGRSDGRIGGTLKKYISDIYVDIVSLDQTIEDKLLYDVILVYNTIHYKTHEEWEKIFPKLKKLLNENGFICIADVFYSDDNAFQSTVLLDWITHGGVYNIYTQEVIEQLQSIGFAKVERRSIESISTDLLFAYK